MYPELNRAKFLAAAGSNPLVTQAYDTAEMAHQGQLRADNQTPYFEHPRAVAWILVHELQLHDPVATAAALLHDVLEDTEHLTSADLLEQFGPEVAETVELLTIREKSQYLPKMLASHNWRAVLVKLADYIQNLRTAAALSNERAERYQQGVAEHYQSLLNRLPAELAPVSIKISNRIKTELSE